MPAPRQRFASYTNGSGQFRQQGRRKDKNGVAEAVNAKVHSPADNVVSPVGDMAMGADSILVRLRQKV
jgi:hypothetical protein